MSSEYAGKEYSVYRTSDKNIVETTTRIPTLGPKDVLIRTTHSGVCHTDALFFANDAPLALGHEGVGIVEAVGSEVSQFRVGDRAGGGFHRSSCGHCKYCLSGRDILCDERLIFGEGDFDNGTFGQYYIGKETYVHRIPDGLSSAEAAPLHCAGATVYSALKYTLKSNNRVGIIGIGGLGHLAIQYAAKMGAEVVVFSTSADKESEARSFGASEFVLLSEVEKIRAPVDILVLTGAKYPDWEKFMVKNVLARDGTVVPLSAPVYGPLTLPADRMFWQVYHVHSGLVASRADHDEMLEFSARHGVKPLLQLHKFEGPKTVTGIFASMFENKVRYRAVIEF